MARTLLVLSSHPGSVCEPVPIDVDENLDSREQDSHASDESADAMNSFTAMIDALGEMHKNRGISKHHENYGIKHDIELISKHWQRLAANKENAPLRYSDKEKYRIKVLREGAPPHYNNTFLT